MTRNLKKNKTKTKKDEQKKIILSYFKVLNLRIVNVRLNRRPKQPLVREDTVGVQNKFAKWH